MKILTKVTVKQVLTETSKKELFISFSNRKAQLKKELEQLQFEWKRVEKARKYPDPTLRQRFEKEMDTRLEKIKLLDFQMEQLDVLPIGSELKEDELQGLVEVKVGDDWNKIRFERSIIVKDGIVIDIQ
ncbi:YlqD family protein [Fervidibacillus halotolerans]|uniref:YlqD family protein n=1 Tax=Fervidibacillus halotolerans TaxID=2980027 RepID=A0A9E8M1P4_9BACI|nr:YlqD family protein [Fervidibacillus halotolerans]WAA13624.1 YlqD family protein [Fervidibacillus halotolerans]